jgi:hypothetical protein
LLRGAAKAGRRERERVAARRALGRDIALPMQRADVLAVELGRPAPILAGRLAVDDDAALPLPAIEQVVSQAYA